MKALRTYWAYEQTNGKIKVVPYTNTNKIDEHAIEDAYANDQIIDVIEGIEAKDINEAFKKAKKEFRDDN